MSAQAVEDQHSYVPIAPGDRNRTTLSINELIIGRQSTMPIYDVNGVLLLAENQLITTEIKANLKNRVHGGTIQVDDADLSKLTLRQVEVKEVPRFPVDEALCRRLDMILDNGLINVKNTGPSYKDQVVEHGCEAYDAEQRERLLEQNAHNAQTLQSMLTDATNGNLKDCDAIAVMAAQYLKEMAVDTENVLTSVIGNQVPGEVAASSLESALLAMAIGIEMDFDADNIKSLGIAALTHDWGMAHVSPDLLALPRKLSRVERLEIERHPIYSMEMLQKVASVPKIVPLIVYQVHERYNGTGYPRGRRGNSIPIFARIIAVADIFISLTAPRPWRPAVTRYGAMECMLHHSRERSLDPDVMRALLRIQSLFPIGSFVTLSDGSVAQVIRANRNNYTQPILQLVQMADGSPADPNAEGNVIDLGASELKVEQALPTPGREEIPFSADLFDEY
ncbi:MAG: hypothetical protein CMJ46_14025 [Planctomyces sp.]|nr:hypothetical protein [Planctomyces sp.]